MAQTFRPRRRAATSNSVNGTRSPAKWEYVNGKIQNGVDTPLANILSNGHVMNGNNTIDTTPLNVVIVGAGIGGLTAAIGLRRNGHNVTVSYLICSEHNYLTKVLAL